MKKSEAIKRIVKWANNIPDEEKYDGESKEASETRAVTALLDHLVKMGLIVGSWDPEDDEPVCGAV